jgi:hypothetical protein
VARPERLLLLDKRHPGPLESLPDLLGGMADDHQGLLGPGSQGASQDVFPERQAGQAMEHFGSFGFEPRRLACRKNEDRKFLLRHLELHTGSEDQSISN